MRDVLCEKTFKFLANFPLSTSCWGDLTKKLGPTFMSNRGHIKVGGGRRRAAVESAEWEVIDFNADFSQTYSFVYFEIFGIVEATYPENMKPICRFNQLCKFEAVYFSAYLFSI